MIIIYFLIAIWSIYFILFFRFGSPYKIEIVFGKTGSGKTTYLVKRMLKAQKKGWTVYTDIPDVCIPGVRTFNTFDLCNKIPEEKSICFIDEAGITFDSREFKKLDNGFRDFLCLHRHYRTSLVFASQTGDVDKKIRDRAHALYLVQGFGRLSIVRPIKRTVTLTEASSVGESRIADQLKFRWLFSWRFVWLPRYQCWFRSFSAPPRDKLSFELLAGDPLGKKQLRALQRSFRHSSSSRLDSRKDGDNKKAH